MRILGIVICVLALGMSSLVSSASNSGKLADASGQAEPGYFIRNYATVIAGSAIDRQCKFFNNWQRQLLAGHTKSLEPLMAQRLSTQAINRVKEISNKMTLDNVDCGDQALTIADQSLFAAHSLLHARPAGLDENNLSEEMREFVGWAEAEIEGHKRRRAARVAARKRAEQESADQSLQFTAATEAYYLERLCQHLNSMDARVYWQIIAKAHKQAVAKHGVKKVRVIQAKATELAKTRARRCGTETRQIVMEGFALARKGFKVAALVLP